MRARIDGVTRTVATIPKQMQPAVVTRLKIMGRLDIAERRAPQDGRVSVRFGGEPLDLRIAILPTTHGEQVVLRILHRAVSKPDLEQLGMTPPTRELFERAIRQPYGAVDRLRADRQRQDDDALHRAAHAQRPGPRADDDRGSGRVPDPRRQPDRDLAQERRSPSRGGLRTILRSDPDVLLVGEIRDEETARIAMQAGMTGHLVLTTLHAHNAAGSIARLKDMGVEPGLLASSVNCVVAQRLARRLCTDCRESYWPTDDELQQLGLWSRKARSSSTAPKGCAPLRQHGLPRPGRALRGDADHARGAGAAGVRARTRSTRRRSAKG